LSLEDDRVTSPHYALNRIERAMETASNNPDPEVRKRALEKIETWKQVISGMSSGKLSVGSRTPVAETPAWVTLEVAHGGFATGKFLAEGPMHEHETSLLERLPPEVPGETGRARLNHYFLSDHGQTVLLAVLDSGAFTVSVPEEGALLTVVWLLEHKYLIEALSLIEELQPFMHRLRFYPKLESSAQPPGLLVRRCSVSDVRKKLSRVVPQPQVAAMTEALEIWNPLYDRLVKLWLETVEGDLPGEKIPFGWELRRDQWLKEYDQAANLHRKCGKHKHAKSNFGRLRKALRSFQTSRVELTSHEWSWVRRALANDVTKRGLLDSPERGQLREEQKRQVDLPTRVQLADAVRKKLAEYPGDSGLASVSPLVEDIHGKLQSSFEGKIRMALEASVEELVEQDVVSSAEVLAQVVPQITSQVSATSVEDPDLRRLFTRVYSAFKRRRSLLLLNYESQVRLEELPWIKAISRFRQESPHTESIARRTLENLSLLTLANFPQTMVPNPLVSELSALAKQARLKMPLVQEVAADIFMGNFTPKWGLAAQQAYSWLEGSFYTHYYQIERPGKQRFSDLCCSRSSEAGSGENWITGNGAVLEQSQILTTHNLAQMTFGLGLQQEVRGLAPQLAQKAFSFVVRRQNRPAADFRARLQMLKNTAYAWRQGIFFFSLASPVEKQNILAALQAEVSQQSQDWILRFQPAVNGLGHVLDGGRFDSKGIGIQNRRARRFLGWARGHHWLMIRD
jgi:hypothetical protein